MDKDSKIYVAGHRGLVGSAIVRKIEAEGYKNIVVRTSSELDLRNQAAVADFFHKEKPEYVFLAAAKVGGIVANNSFPAEFIYDNLMIQTNVIHHAWLNGVTKLLFLGSTCIYPKLAPQPIKEEYLLTGPLEPTNEAYAIAKIAGIKMCQSYNRQYGTRFVSAMPTNLYGPNDNFDLETSHVLPALIRKFHEAKMGNGERGTGNGEKHQAHVTIWGSGTPKREFIHVDDLADACLFLMTLPEEQYRSLLIPGPQSPVPALINIGSGEEVTISELALRIKEIVGFAGELVFDSTKPDGTPRKLSDVSRIHAIGWKHKINLEEGLRNVYRWYLKSVAGADTETHDGFSVY
ncbi:GDP-L-fucose synthase family protein [Geotalea uraniireducens]|uniref:GDP-L-fucose synthase n=1 Tax=Geotalea uraniireducens (strain Rf4) TaxID=351605 RepID=A5G6F2_GEOUR|nr:GDP-L-fucose synthase [Geotalea uraniireducens]ABQ27370.1 NAD-dependent epimerase/dehydratase [Geotalea uraniireducens Rf4]